VRGAAAASCCLSFKMNRCWKLACSCQRSEADNVGTSERSVGRSKAGVRCLVPAAGAPPIDDRVVFGIWESLGCVCVYNLDLGLSFDLNARKEQT
jgi:hypothetical protein